MRYHKVVETKAAEESQADEKEYFGTQLAYGKTKSEDDGLFKAYIPNYLYKPPYGMPRKVNTGYLKSLAKNPYIFSVIKTLADEASSVSWEIRIKEEFQEEQKLVEGNDVDDLDESEVSEKSEKNDYSEDVNRVTKFFKNPNGNDESFQHLMRQWITDLGEIDSAVGIKVFNYNGEMVQLFARDGATFLKNPDIYGYMGNRADFVFPLPASIANSQINMSGASNADRTEIMKVYDALYKERAAYFQYGWTAGSMPIPFGKREIVYMMQNPRGDSIYGRSPVEMLTEIVMTLTYGSEYNLDFYTQNNMPDGAISLLGAQPGQVKQFRENWEKQFKFTDSLGKKRKRFFKVPISNTEVKFTPFQLSAKDMEVLEQQKWFTKVMWMCYGVTAEEMGFTEDSNKAVSREQSKVAKRKAIKPLLETIQYHINTQMIPEFFVKSSGSEDGIVSSEIPDFSDVPVEFVFKDYDVDEDKKQHDLWEQQIRMGVKTAEMVAKEMGVDVFELQRMKEENIKRQQELMGGQEDDGYNSEVSEDSESKDRDYKEEADYEENEKDADDGFKKEKEDVKEESKSMESEADSTAKEIDKAVDEMGRALMEAIDRIPEDDYER